jgi:glycerophosphoryl diester phosphodiesterase
MKVIIKFTHFLFFTCLFINIISCKNSSIGHKNSIVSTVDSNTLLKTKYHLGVSAHRGNSKVAPENTLATFSAILEIGVDFIEIDVRTSKDGKLVILHDGNLNRTTNGDGPMKDFTLVELKKLSAGKGFGETFQNERIPTLEETVGLIAAWNAKHKRKTNLYVDCKDVQPKPLIEQLSAHKMLGNAVFYGSDDFLLSLKKLFPKAKLLPALDAPNEIKIKSEKLKPYAFDVRWNILNDSLVNAIHRENIKVFSDVLAFTDTPQNYQKAVKMGIDVIQTDNVRTVYRTLLNENSK